VPTFCDLDSVGDCFKVQEAEKALPPKIEAIKENISSLQQAADVTKQGAHKNGAPWRPEHLRVRLFEWS
jgi:hypothetical protein